MATQSQFIANRLNTQKSTSTRSLSMSLGTPADCFMQNKANFQNAQMNVNKVLTRDYGNFRLYGRRENKPNSNPIKAKQTQFKANSKGKKICETCAREACPRCFVLLLKTAGGAGICGYKKFHPKC